MTEDQPPQGGITEEDMASILAGHLGREGVHVGGDIPQEKLARARQQCGISPDEPVLGMVDFTMLGSGKHALVFGRTCAYYHNAPTSKSPGAGRIAYDELADREIADGGLLEVSLGADEFLNVSGPNVTKDAVIEILQALRERLAAGTHGEPDAEVDEAERDVPEVPAEEDAAAATSAPPAPVENDASDAERGRSGPPSGTHTLGYGLANLKHLIRTDALKSEDEDDESDETWQDGSTAQPTTTEDPPAGDDEDGETPVMLDLLDDEDDSPAAPVKLEAVEPAAPVEPAFHCPQCNAGPDTYKTVHFGSEEVLRCMACGYRDSDDGEDADIAVAEVSDEPADDESELVPLIALDGPATPGGIPEPKGGMSVGGFWGCVLVAIVAVWVLSLTLLNVGGIVALAWGKEYLVVLGIGVGAVLILSLAGAVSAARAAKNFPELSRTSHLDPDSYYIRDEAAIRLAILFELGFSSHFVFRRKLERLSAALCMLAGVFLEIVSWIIVLVVPASASLSGKAARTLRARRLTSRLRWLHQRGVFSDADIQRAQAGMLPSDPDSVWCVAGLDGPIYVLTAGEDEISVRTLGKADPTVLPMRRLAGAAIAAFARKQRRKDPQLYGFASIVWEIPRVLEKGGPLYLSASLHRGAFQALSAWRLAAAGLAQPPQT